MRVRDEDIPYSDNFKLYMIYRGTSEEMMPEYELQTRLVSCYGTKMNVLSFSPISSVMHEITRYFILGALLWISISQTIA